MTIHTQLPGKFIHAPIPTQYSIPLSVKLINHAGPNRDNALNLSGDSKQVKIAFDFSRPTLVFMPVLSLCRTFTSASQKISSFALRFSLKNILTMIMITTGAG